MKIRRAAGSLLVAAGLAGGVFAAPAQAEPGDPVGGADIIDSVGGADIIDSVGGADIIDSVGGADLIDRVGNVTDFLTTLDGLGLTDIDPGDAVAIGQSLCPMLAERGQNTADIAAEVSEAIGRPLGPSTMFAGTAISFLCPRAVENVTNNLVDGKPLLPLFGG